MAALFTYTNCILAVSFLKNDETLLDAFPETIEMSIYVYIAMLVIMFTFLVILFILTNRIGKLRKEDKEKVKRIDSLEQQKVKLEIKDRDITDSLIYAQRIQEALLPSEGFLKESFKDFFVFFKPRDIVSGDFYWIGEKGNKIFFVAADCTGHGVPGALMSMIGMEILDKAINENKIENPSVILEIMNINLAKTFNKKSHSKSVIRDGMDLGLIVIDCENKKLDFSGAFFPLYLIRNNHLIEYKGDKVILGIDSSETKYRTQTINLEEDDIIYLFSDGYADQFGGVGNKKFMYRRFRYLLSTINQFPMADQKVILEDNIRTWMGGNPQVDDMMVIGIKPLSGKKTTR